MKQTKILPFLLIPSLLAGCLNRETAESSVSAPTSDIDEVTISADFTAEEGDSTKTVLITSNRSWSAHLNDLDNPVPVGQKVDWAYLSEEGFLNLSKKTVTKEIKIIFLPNKINIPNKGVLEIYSEGKLSKSIAINQLAAVYRLDAQVESTDVSAAAGDVIIKVNCNTAWTARVADGATANATLPVSSGYESGELKVKFGENFSTKETKSASIIISAEDCEDKIIAFNQGLAIPYLELVSPASAKLDPTATNGVLSFKTNCDWTIETSGNTFRNFSLSSDSGIITDVTEFDIPYTFSFPDDPKVTAEATFKISVAENIVNPVSVKISQTGHFNIEFASITFTPALPTSGSGNVTVGMKENNTVGVDHWLDKDYYNKENNSITFKFKTTEGNEYALVADARLNANDYVDSKLKALYLYNLGNGYEVGTSNAGVKNVPPYWSYPGIEGMVLKKLIYHCVYDSSNANKNRFNCYLFPEDFRYGPYGFIASAVKDRNTAPTYGIYAEKLAATQLAYFKSGITYKEDTDFELDLAKMNVTLPAGKGITVGSIQNPTPPTQCFVRAVELFYEPAK